jgi:Suppressor of fused protein (SUFU).
MKKEEYIKRCNEQEDWAPGWEAIDSCFELLYPGQNPSHFATDMDKRAMFGGEQYIDGYSLFQSEKGYKHVVTYGMSELYMNEEAFGGEYSKWGYEMTIKLPETEAKECIWALNVLSNLARYTFTTGMFFEPLQYISGNGNPLFFLLTSLLVVEDTEAKGTDTVHGRLEFMQLVGITQTEFDAVITDPENVKLLVENMKKENPMLITDLKRTKNYL